MQQRSSLRVYAAAASFFCLATVAVPPSLRTSRAIWEKELRTVPEKDFA